MEENKCLKTSLGFLGIKLLSDVQFLSGAGYANVRVRASAVSVDFLPLAPPSIKSAERLEEPM